MSTSGNALIDAATGKLLSSLLDVGSPASGVLPITNGGTGANNSTTARSNLGLGSMATQSSSTVNITGGTITGITDLAIADGGTGASTASGARTNLGLGTIATQDANNVSITGGSITAITDLAIVDGGTGASTAENARFNLGVIGILSTTIGIDGKVATTTNLYTVPSSKTAIVTAATIRLAAATALSGTLHAGIGIASGESDIFAPVSMTGFNAITKCWGFSASGTRVVGTAGQIIKLGIRTGFGGTSATLEVDLIGYLI